VGARGKGDAGSHKGGGVKALYLALGRDLSQSDAGTTHTISVVKALAELGVEMTLAARKAPRETGGIAFVAAAAQKPFGSGRIKLVPDELIEAAKGADIIQERVEESGGVGVRIAKAAGKPLVLEINTPLSGYPNPILRRVADMNLRRQARAARAVITQTPISRAIIESYTQAAVFVAPNGADPRVFGPDVTPAEVPGATARRRVVAFAGSLRPWHGVEDLLAAGRRVLARHPEVFFLIVGGGRRQAALEEMAQQMLSSGNYHFTGAVPPADVPHYLARADVLAAPFAPRRDAVRRRQFDRHGMWWSPVKIFEYMATGRPIVASAAGMIPEYIAGTGVTYTPGSIEELAEAVLRLIESAAEAGALARAARQRLVTNYTWRHAAGLTIAAWRKVLDGRQKVSVTR
jgi:glycosyltransferase involved in cell wall biosynthesis